MVTGTAIHLSKAAFGFHELFLGMRNLAVHTGHIHPLFGFQIVSCVLHNFVYSMECCGFLPAICGSLFRVDGILDYAIGITRDGPN